MCSHYQAVKERERFFRHFGVYPPDDTGKYDIWPGYSALMLRRPSGPQADPDATLEVVSGVFGLLPHWARDQRLARSTYNARSETVHEKPSFRDAWRRGQHCIIPAEAIYEPDWRSGRAVPTRIQRADGEPMGLAGLWSWWRSPGGDTVHSFSMLTINADTHGLMRNFHKPADEKRMVVVLEREHFAGWLDATLQDSMAYLRQYPAELLVSSA